MPDQLTAEDFQPGDRVELSGEHISPALRGCLGTVVDGAPGGMVAVNIDDGHPEYRNPQYLNPKRLTKTTKRHE